jgi:hypothetical protein
MGRDGFAQIAPHTRRMASRWESHIPLPDAAIGDHASADVVAAAGARFENDLGILYACLGFGIFARV